MSLIPDRFYCFLPGAVQFLPWIGLVLSLMGSLGSLLYREIEYIQGDVSWTYTQNKDGVYVNRWMVANYIGPYSYLDENVPLSNPDNTPFHYYPFEKNKDLSILWSSRLGITANIFCFISIYCIGVTWCLIEAMSAQEIVRTPMNNNIVEGGKRRRFFPIFGWITLLFLLVTSYVHFLQPNLLYRSHLLCHDVTNATVAYDDGSNYPFLLIVQPQCSSWAFGSYAYFFASFAWLMVLLVLLLKLDYHYNGDHHVDQGSSCSPVAVPTTEEEGGEEQEKSRP
mmetsp:Transcript_24484/g.35816  ORF Transcript_24484/g.35816 Transcript_24484/m.35816 type:complete len:281 (-) Transcript_24484:307-1149(-)